MYTWCVFLQTKSRNLVTSINLRQVYRKLFRDFENFCNFAHCGCEQCSLELIFVCVYGLC